ncbi:hypothetical protein DF185_00095 [Marinifilum breve]|uniref:Uncharacterized protein n=1 Tax=Marinifilum breve TaxID=2184082 RepID=A0A2V4A578_9BACT|nr:hypothetical protein [Marinifilum breve]PXY02530.1 hypothetical protein DF185_00095 [Marinifilum breve]
MTFDIIFTILIIIFILYTKGESAITHPKFKALIKWIDNGSIWLVRKSVQSSFTNFYRRRGKLLRFLMASNFFLIGFLGDLLWSWITLSLVIIELILVFVYYTIKPIPVYLQQIKKAILESRHNLILFIVGGGVFWMVCYKSLNQKIQEVLAELKTLYNLLNPMQVKYIIVILILVLAVPLFPLIWRLIIWLLSRMYKIFVVICFQLNRRKPIRSAILLVSIITLVITKTLEILLKASN